VRRLQDSQAMVDLELKLGNKHFSILDGVCGEAIFFEISLI
jgi:hypothetical protein